MAKQDIRDAKGALIGWIETSSGKQTLRDRRGAMAGTYDPRLDETRDQKGAYVGKGNQLMRLL